MSTHIETIYIHMCRIWIFAKIFDPFDGDEIRHVFFLPGYPYMTGQRHAEHLQFFWAIVGVGSGRITGNCKGNY